MIILAATLTRKDAEGGEAGYGTYPVVQRTLKDITIKIAARRQIFHIASKDLGKQRAKASIKIHDIIVRYFLLCKQEVGYP